MARRLILVVGFVLMGVATAARAQPGACRVTTNYQVASVRPYEVNEEGGFPLSTPRLRGAEMRVVAQPGLTAEWLQRTVEVAIANGECGFLGAKVNVSVQSAGDGYHVYLTSSDQGGARDILARAERLAP